MPQERDRQGRWHEGHGHFEGECFQSSEQPGEPVMAIYQNILLHGKAPPTCAAEPQPRVKITPFDNDRCPFALRAFGRSERALKITVQTRLELRRLVRKALGNMPLQECP